MVSKRHTSAGFTIGIVGNDDAVRHSLRTLLESHGLAVADFPSGAAYLDSPSRKAISCLVIDLSMQGVSGLDVIEKLRAQADRTPAILLAGEPDTGLSQRIHRAAVLALLIKPVAQNEILAWIEQAKARWRANM